MFLFVNKFSLYQDMWTRTHQKHWWSIRLDSTDQLLSVRRSRLRKQRYWLSFSRGTSPIKISLMKELGISIRTYLKTARKSLSISKRILSVLPWISRIGILPCSHLIHYHQRMAQRIQKKTKMKRYLDNVFFLMLEREGNL